MQEHGSKHMAVVIIHGIGNQRPLATLRSFMAAIAAKMPGRKADDGDRPVFWDKPDSISGSFEARRMTLKSGRQNEITDFYEFYWAQHMRDTTFAQTKDWLRHLLFRRPQDVPSRIRPVWHFCWALAIVALAMVVAPSFIKGFSAFHKVLSWLATSAVAVAAYKYVSQCFLDYLGHAARYMDPVPENVNERQQIRLEGVTFLRKLHESGQYDRIVVVGHSLGSVIAYDLLKFLWVDYYKSFDPAKFKAVMDQPPDQKRAVLHEVRASEDFQQGTPGDWDVAQVAQFQEAQGRSADYLRRIGNGWLVTDLITMGAPLAHAGYLIMKNDSELAELKEMREYPTCPPTIQHGESSNIHSTTFDDVPGFNEPKTVAHFVHSAPFAVTRWTNIFYESDYIGGPLQKVFGKGIKDLKKPALGKFNLYPWGHTEYWRENFTESAIPEIWECLKRRPVVRP